MLLAHAQVGQDSRTLQHGWALYEGILNVNCRRPFKATCFSAVSLSLAERFVTSRKPKAPFGDVAQELHSILAGCKTAGSRGEREKIAIMH